jgi:peptidoglycan hydrolase CwlO-like protein
MYQYPQFDVNEEIHKQVKHAFNQVQRIPDQIEERINGLNSQRKDIDQRLMTQIKEFHNELQEIKSQIEDFKTKISPKQFADYNNQIA